MPSFKNFSLSEMLCIYSILIIDIVLAVDFKHAKSATAVETAFFALVVGGVPACTRYLVHVGWFDTRSVRADVAMLLTSFALCAALCSYFSGNHNAIKTRDFIVKPPFLGQVKSRII